MAKDVDEKDLFDGLNPWESNFREQMKIVRERMGMNQTDLAKRMASRGFAFHQQTVQRIEQGARPIRLNEAIVIANILEMSLSTMTATLNYDERTVIEFVDYGRREAGTVSTAIGDMRAELDEAVAPLMAYVYERLKVYEGEVDPILKYAYTWAGILHDVHNTMLDAQQLAENAAEGRVVEPISSHEMYGDMFAIFDSERHPNLEGGLDEYPARPGDHGDEYS